MIRGMEGKVDPSKVTEIIAKYGRDVSKMRDAVG